MHIVISDLKKKPGKFTIIQISKPIINVHKIKCILSQFNKINSVCTVLLDPVFMYYQDIVLFTVLHIHVQDWSIVHMKVRSYLST